jgi:hypothetical protein
VAITEAMVDLHYHTGYLTARPERQFDDWQPLEDLLTALAVR